MTNHREEILWRIAELYTDLADPTGGPSDIRGTGEGNSTRFPGHDSTCMWSRSWPEGQTPHCTCSHRTIREYERLVKLMRDDRSEPLIVTPTGKVSVRSAWWHLEHYHHRAQRVIKHHPVTSKTGGKLTTLRNQNGSPVTRPTIAHLRDPKANEAKARLAITWIAQHWGLPVEPMVPQAVVSWKGAQVAA